MSDDLMSYFLQQARREAADSAYNMAASRLDNARIRERLAEINSQHDPLAKLSVAPLTERERMYAAAHYVVTGRMPTPTKREKDAEEEWVE